jgi:hypothetical protein
VHDAPVKRHNPLHMEPSTHWEPPDLAEFSWKHSTRTAKLPCVRLSMALRLPGTDCSNALGFCAEVHSLEGLVCAPPQGCIAMAHGPLEQRLLRWPTCFSLLACSIQQTPTSLPPSRTFLNDMLRATLKCKLSHLIHMGLPSASFC